MFGVSNVGIIPVKSVVSSYTYWRVVTTQSRTTDGFGVNLATVAFSNTSGGAQLPFSTSFASSNAGGNPASSAFDTSASTFWSSASGVVLPQSVGVLLSTATSITYLKLQAADSATRASRAPRFFRVEASNNGSSYTTIYTSPEQAVWSPSETRNYYIGP